MLGENFLVAPVMRLGQRTRRVYLPEGFWQPIEGGEIIPGGGWIDADAPLERMPVYRRVKET
jgi:alpha-D-xyloside xylohydrolase